jgi:hypothetical protein
MREPEKAKVDALKTTLVRRSKNSIHLRVAHLMLASSRAGKQLEWTFICHTGKVCPKYFLVMIHECGGSPLFSVSYGGGACCVKPML